MEQSGLDEFKSVLSDFRSLSALALKGAIVLPLLNVLIKIGPPPSLALSVLTAGTLFLSVLWVFQFRNDAARDRVQREMKVAGSFAILAAIASAVFISQYTVRPDNAKESVVLGFAVRADVKPLLSANYTERQALEDSEDKPERVWQQWSITTVHLAMVLCWLLAFFCFGEFVAMFVLVQRRTVSAAPSPPAKVP